MHQYRTSIILALALANSVSALLSRPTWRVSANTAATEPAVEPKVVPQPAYEGLVLPYDMGVPGFMKDIVDQGLLKSDPAQPRRAPEVREGRTRDAECGSYARPSPHAEKLKEVYQKKIQERPDFNDVGFILTDYCTDFYDGKQLTIATYI